jgi:hypothetical protein
VGMVKYRTEYFFAPIITKVEVDKETYANVWINGQRVAKGSKYVKYFDTFFEAKNFLVHNADREVAMARIHLENESTKLAIAQALKEDSIRGEA